MFRLSTPCFEHSALLVLVKALVFFREVFIVVVVPVQYCSSEVIQIVKGYRTGVGIRCEECFACSFVYSDQVPVVVVCPEVCVASSHCFHTCRCECYRRDVCFRAVICLLYV